MCKKIGSFCMVTGIILIITAVGLLLYNLDENKKAEEASKEILEVIKKTISDEEENDIAPIEEESMQIKIIDGYGYIGYLYIPRLELELPVMSEWDYTRLKSSPCLYYGSVNENDLVIAGHNYAKHFGHLSDLQEGDEVYFMDMNGVLYSYEVGGSEILQPNEIEKMVESEWDLTLYTCTYGGQSRITVRCMRVYEK